MKSILSEVEWFSIKDVLPPELLYVRVIWCNEALRYERLSAKEGLWVANDGSSTNASKEDLWAFADDRKSIRDLMKYKLVFTFLLSLLGFTYTSYAQTQIPTYESNMTSFGKTHCAFLKDPTQPFDPLLLATYYDAERVYLQIADYTHDTSWVDCANAARAIYRDKYLIPNNGALPGYWLFSEGLARDSLKDVTSKQALDLLAKNGAYCASSGSVDKSLPSEVYSREASYCTEANLNNGGIQRAKDLREYIFGYFDQWFVKRSAPFIKPFMVALAAEALIKMQGTLPDARTLPAIKLACDELWKYWVDSAQAFKYMSVPSATEQDSPAPDLNLLIVPMYGWVYSKTHDQSYKDKGDKIFDSGVKNSYLTGAKQFNQSYRWSMDYLKWAPNPPQSKYVITTAKVNGKDVITITIP